LIGIGRIIKVSFVEYARPSGFGFRSGFNWFSENMGTLETLSVTEGSPTAWLGLEVSERLKGLQFRTTTAVQHLALCVLELLAVSGKVLAGSGGQF